MGGPKPSQAVNLVEDFTDHVKRRGVVRAAHSKENADCVTNLGRQRTQLGERSHGSIEHKIFGMLIEELLNAELRATVAVHKTCPCRSHLHDIELAVHRPSRPSGSTKIKPYIPLAKCSATIGVTAPSKSWISLAQGSTRSDAASLHENRPTESLCCRLALAAPSVELRRPFCPLPASASPPSTASSGGHDAVPCWPVSQAVRGAKAILWRCLTLPGRTSITPDGVATGDRCGNRRETRTNGAVWRRLRLSHTAYSITG